MVAVRTQTPLLETRDIWPQVVPELKRSEENQQESERPFEEAEGELMRERL